jgi:quinoprotein glucose dehydrogenase
MALRALIASCFVTTFASSANAQAAGEWTAYGRDASGTRFSPLTQIERGNVATLAVAWTYRTGEMDVATRKPAKLEATPLMVDGTLYLSTPLGRVVALDPETGRARWTYDIPIDRGGSWSDWANRGVSTWVDTSASVTAPCRRRLFATTIDGRIVALDARTGQPCAGFGDAGTISLRRGLRNGPYYQEEYEVTSPPAVINGIIVTGSAIADNTRANAPSGEVRGYDARTGALRWTWDPVPRDSTDPAWQSWSNAMGHSTGAANAWSVIAADAARDLVFVPTGSASPDYYGGERLGDNRYANSVVALRASTGKVVWSFQAVHHDLWDYDLASPTVLGAVVRDGRRVEAVLQATKSGQLFVLDRNTGAPVFPVEERAVPQNGVRTERPSPTQPFNTVIPALSPQSFRLEDFAAGVCRDQVRALRNDGPFTPPTLGGTLVVPSNVGGAHWGGLAYDTTRHLAIVPVNRLAALIQLIPADQLDTAEVRQNSARFGDEYTRMHGTPYILRRRILLVDGVPCTPPPYASLVAINLETGARAWEAPLPTPALGGPIVTAGGVVFMAGTFDHALRAFDVETGRELWKGELPAGARATPMTYQIGNRQFVVIAVGGGEYWGKGDYVVAFTLPR